MLVGEFLVVLLLYKIKKKMKIDKILSQHRRDFHAIYICEHCGYKEEKSGYDDNYFHTEVIPKMVCPQCGKTADSDYRPLQTKYPDNFEI